MGRSDRRRVVDAALEQLDGEAAIAWRERTRRYRPPEQTMTAGAPRRPPGRCRDCQLDAPCLVHGLAMEAM